MDFMKYRIKNMEPFKDGNVLGGKFLKPNEVIEVSESDLVKIRNSGGLVEVLEVLVPNPKKVDPVVEEILVEQEQAEVEQEQAKQAEVAQAKEEVVRAETPAKRRPGRPSKKAA